MAARVQWAGRRHREAGGRVRARAAPRAQPRRKHLSPHGV